MPLDTSIPLQVRAPQFEDYSQLAAQTQLNMLRAQQTRQDLELNAMRMRNAEEAKIRAAAQAAAAERRRQELMDVYSQFGASPAAVGQRGTSYSGTGVSTDPYAPITGTLIQRGFLPQAEEFMKIQKSAEELPGVRAESRKKGTEADIAEYNAAVARLVPLVRSVKSGPDAASFVNTMYDDPTLGPRLEKIVPRAQAVARAPAEYEADPLAWMQSHMLTGEELSNAFAKATEKIETPQGYFEYNVGKGTARPITTQGAPNEPRQPLMPVDRRNVTTIDMKGEGKFAEEMAKADVTSITESEKAAKEAASVINTIQQGRSLLDEGVISGFGADFKLGFAKAAKALNLTDTYGNKIENTESYAANMAKNVGLLIKQFGAGTGLSNADREYAERMAGGQISLDEASMRKILDISERAARNVVTAHNEMVKGVESRVRRTVEMPPERKSTASGAGGTSVTTPDGRVFSFPTPEAAAQFKKAAGIP